LNQNNELVFSWSDNKRDPNSCRLEKCEIIKESTLTAKIADAGQDNLTCPLKLERGVDHEIKVFERKNRRAIHFKTIFSREMSIFNCQIKKLINI